MIDLNFHSGKIVSFNNESILHDDEWFLDDAEAMNSQSQFSARADLVKSVRRWGASKLQSVAEFWAECNKRYSKYCRIIQSINFLPQAQCQLWFDEIIV